MLFEDLSQSAKLRALKQIPNGHTTSDYRFTEDPGVRKRATTSNRVRGINEVSKVL